MFQSYTPRGAGRGQGAGGCGDVSVLQPVRGWQSPGAVVMFQCFSLCWAAGGLREAGNVDVSVLRPVRWGSRAELGDYGGQRMESSMFRCWSHSAAGMGEHQFCIVTALAQV